MVKKTNLTKRRDFIKKAGLVTAGVGATTLVAPYGYAATNPVKWRLQTYSGAPLGNMLFFHKLKHLTKLLMEKWKLNCIMQIN